jgi:hypothetical protein
MIIYDILIFLENGIDLGFCSWLWLFIPQLSCIFRTIMACTLMLWSYKRATKGMKRAENRVNWLPMIYVVFWGGTAVNVILVAITLFKAIIAY